MKSTTFRTALRLTMALALSVACLVIESEAAEVKPILVGAPGSYAASPWAWSALRGQELAVKEINAAGGVKVGSVNRPFKLETIDTRDEEPGVPVSDALLGIEKLILEKKVNILCGGPTMSEASLAVIDLVAKHNIVDLRAGGTWTPGWPKKVGGDIGKYRTSFKVTNSVAYVIPEGVELLDHIKNKFGYNTVYLLTQDNLISRNAGELFSKLAVQKGWKLLGSDMVPQGTTDYSPQLLKCKSLGAKVLMIWTNDPTAIILMKQFMDMKVPSFMIGFMPAATEADVWNEVSGKCQYVIGPLGYAASTTTKLPGAVKFQKAYKEFCGKEAFGGAVEGYVGMYVLKDAIERAGSLDTNALIAALEKTDYMSINGRVRFDKNHMAVYSSNPAEGMVSNWFQWIAGKRVTIWPPSIADSEIQIPPWMK